MTDLSLSVVWAVENPKSTNFGLSPKMALHAKFTLSHGLTSGTSAETVSAPLTLLKYYVECPFTAKNQLMEASNGLTFLPLLAVLELLGLKISWFPNHVGETEVNTKLGLPQLDPQS